MMPTSAPVSAGVPVADWLLPAPSDARMRLEKVVMADGKEIRVYGR